MRHARISRENVTAAGPGLALDAHATAVRLDDVLDHREPDARAGDVLPLGLGAAHELAEDLALLGGRNAETAIANVNGSPRSRGVPRRPYRAARRRILDGVVQQVPECIGQRLCIGEHRNRLVTGGELDRVSAGRDFAVELADDGSRPYGQVHRLFPVWRSAGLHASEVEQRFHEMVQALRLPQERFVIGPSPVVGDAPLVEHFADLSQRRQRRAEFVRHGGDEIGLQSRHREFARTAAGRRRRAGHEHRQQSKTGQPRLTARSGAAELAGEIGM